MEAGADSSLAGGASSAASLDFEDSSFAGASDDFSPPASSMEKDSKAETSAPSSMRTAMGCSESVYRFLRVYCIESAATQGGRVAALSNES